MDFPADRKYTEDHEWASHVKDNVYEIGVTSYALDQLGDVVYVDLPEVGVNFVLGDSFGSVESTKTVSDLYMPISGKIVAVNDSLTKDNFDLLNKEPYEAGWLIRISVPNKSDVDSLLSAEDYKTYLEQQEDSEDDKYNGEED